MNSKWDIKNENFETRELLQKCYSYFDVKCNFYLQVRFHYIPIDFYKRSFIEVSLEKCIYIYINVKIRETVEN